jgi:SAM-dependent methyltransferase
VLTSTPHKFRAAALGQVFARFTKRWVDAVELPLSERYFDWRLSLDADGIVETPESAAEGSEYKRYEPVPYNGFRRAMRKLDIRRGHDVFIDIGSGRGRALVLAARYPFRKVIGVEFSAELCERARENVARVRSKLVCKDVEIVVADATTYELPAEVNVVYFYNPFTGALLSAVCENLRRSLATSPRPLTVLYANPADFEREVAGADWLRKKDEFTYRHRWVVYESC